MAALPGLPGVYRYFDARDEVLYVGKARNLKKRVSSYFQKDHGGTRIGHMVTRIARLETTVVRTEAEALLLENNLIKTLNPKFNILFRDDKSYPYLKITGTPGAEPATQAARFPRMAYYRGAVDRKHRYFGPYPSAWAVKETIQLMQKVFRLRTCEDTVFANRSRPCLLYQIQRCSGPCVGLMSQADYALDVRNAERFLLGEPQQVIDELQQQHDGLRRSAGLRAGGRMARPDRRAVARAAPAVGGRSSLSASDRDVDILAVRVSGGRACVNLAMVRGGRHLGDRAYFPAHVDEATAMAAEADGDSRGAGGAPRSIEQQVLEAFIAQHYLGQSRAAAAGAEPCGRRGADRGAGGAGRPARARGAPAARAAPHLAGHGATRAPASRWRGCWPRRARSANAPARWPRRWTSTCPTRSASASSVSTSATRPARRRRPPAWCLKTTACRTASTGASTSRHHRRRRLRGDAPGADAALRQAGRGAAGQRRGARPPARLPDLVLVDGGRGQVGVAREVFEELGLDLSLIVGVEKGEGRKVGLEELVFADGRPKVSLGHDSAALMLVAQIRDEAHRFAITGMRARRASVRTGGSRLEDIAGVGPKKRALLLQRFGGVRGVANAGVDDLAAVDGISRELAEAIYRALH